MIVAVCQIWRSNFTVAACNAIIDVNIKGGDNDAGHVGDVDVDVGVGDLDIDVGIDFGIDGNIDDYIPSNPLFSLCKVCEVTLFRSQRVVKNLPVGFYMLSHAVFLLQSRETGAVCDVSAALDPSQIALLPPSVEARKVFTVLTFEA